MNNVIAFTKVKLPFGWLSNMAAFPIVFNNLEWRTTEALFQALRFEDSNPIREMIREEKSPMAAKVIAKSRKQDMCIKPMSLEDLDNMKLCLKTKMEQHPDLWKELLSTKGKIIIEDTTKRPNESGLFWGAALQDDKWVGENWLGKLWMEIRDKKV